MPPVADAVAELLRDCQRVVVLTGAGMSAESHIPTFRDASDSLWARYDPMTLATPEAFAERPDLVWAWYLMRAGLIRASEPHAGHRALTDMGRDRRVQVVTQNVDDLHERAGNDVLAHLHGSIMAFRCARCDRPWDGDLEIPDPVPETVPPPACEACGGPVRPGIVWFGEALPPAALDAAVEAVSEADAVLVVGTSGVVYPAAGLPLMAARAGIPCIEVNPHETDLSTAMALCWREEAGVALPELARRLS